MRLPGRTFPIPGWFPLVVERLHPHLAGSGSTVEFATDDVTMKLDLRDNTQRRIYYLAHERSEVAFVKRFLRRGDVVLDVGANVGYFTLIAARNVGPNREVHAFEPVPANYEALKANVGLNGFDQVRLNQAAAGAGTGVLGLRSPRRPTRSGRDERHVHQARNGGSLTVPLVDLGEYVEQRLTDRPIRLVKLDVERMEPDVLTALEGRISEHPPDAFLIEVNIELLRLNGLRPADVSSRLEQNGYRFFTVGRRGRLRDLPRLPEPEIHRNRQGKGVLLNGLAMRKALYSVVAVAPPREGLSV